MSAGSFEKPKSHLYNSNTLISQDTLEEHLAKCRKIVNELTKDLSEKQAHDALSAAVSKGSQNHEEVCLGLFHVILTDTESAHNAYRDLNLVSRDSMVLIVNKLLQLISEKYLRLMDGVKTQIMWLVTQFVSSSIGGADTICLALLKQAAGGDLTPSNIWLADALLNLFTQNRCWLDKFPQLLQVVVYSYLRLIADHTAGAYKNLRQKEITLCVSILRERFVECMSIGRDLIRMLQNVCKIPEMKSLWKDMLYNPHLLSSQFTGIYQLLNIRTSRRYLAIRLTPDMENKIGFLTSKVKFGHQKRYLEWFHHQYLSSPESQSLRADLIRYICGVVHPSNEILSSDITQRWTVIGWLLSTCPNNVSAANAKLALFYDWLFFQAEDNIMNIEPGILVMYHSLRNHYALTATLLDFLCRSVIEYNQKGQQCKECVQHAFKAILSKKVISSLMPIIDNQRMGQELKSLVRSTFPSFFQINGSTSGKFGEHVIKVEGKNGASHDGDLNMNEGISDAKFSDTEDEADVQMNGLENDIIKFRDGKIKAKIVDGQAEDDDDGDMVDFDELEKLDEDLRDMVLKLQQESNMGTRCDTMESIIACVLNLNEFDDEMNSALATCLNNSLVEDYYNLCLPEKVTDRDLQDSLEGPLYTLFSKIVHLPTHDIGRETIIKLAQEMKSKEPKVSNHFLYYLLAIEQDEENLSFYEEFVRSMKDFKSMSTSLLEDARLCQTYDPKLFVFLAPSLYRKFSEHLVGNVEMLHMLVAVVDPLQLSDLLHEVVLRDLVIFGESNVYDVLKESLSWESYEQYNVWQVLCAEDPPVECFLNLLPLLKATLHSEAISNILLLLKGADLTNEIVSSLLCMECTVSNKEMPKQLSTCLLRYWSLDSSKELAKILCGHIEKNLSTGNRRRQLKSGNNISQPTMEQILVQLECFYRVCQQQQNLDFFKQEMVKRSLEKVKQHCTNSIQQKFHLLFSVCEEQETRRRNVRMSKIVATIDVLSSESEEEEEEEPRKRPTKRKRKQSPDFISDDSDE